MKVTKEYVLRCVMGEYIIVPTGESAVQFSGIISTNATGAFLWEKVQNDITRDELIKELLEEYDVSPEQAQKDVDLFIQELSKQNVIDLP